MIDKKTQYYILSTEKYDVLCIKLDGWFSRAGVEIYIPGKMKSQYQLFEDIFHNQGQVFAISVNQVSDKVKAISHEEAKEFVIFAETS